MLLSERSLFYHIIFVLSSGFFKKLCKI